MLAIRSFATLALCIAGSGCSEDDASTDTTSSSDSGASDTGALDSSDSALSLDSNPVDSGDIGLFDTTSSDSAGSADSADSAKADTTSVDTSSPDTASIDPCTPLPSGLTTWTKSDTASVGTPDTYFLDVTPGDPFCATITGGGGGSWSVNVSNGTSSGLYCSGSAKCSIVVPAGQPTLLVTAVTTDIGAYTLTVRYRPR